MHVIYQLITTFNKIKDVTLPKPKPNLWYKSPQPVCHGSLFCVTVFPNSIHPTATVMPVQSDEVELSKYLLITLRLQSPQANSNQQCGKTLVIQWSMGMAITSSVKQTHSVLKVFHKTSPGGRQNFTNASTYPKTSFQHWYQRKPKQQQVTLTNILRRMLQANLHHA